MREIFYPSSVAVIGVSSRPENLGRNIVANMIEFGFEGIVYAVGPRGGIVETRRIYRSVADIPDHVDLAVILTPAETVPGILAECGQKGIRWAIVETAGFREYGEKGRELEEQMLDVAEEFGIRFIGPNCIGAINMENGLCVPFPRLKRFVKPGEVSIITQSGGVGMSALNLLANEGVGLNKFVSIGNMLDTQAEDLLEYLIEDDGTRLIFIYLETITDGRRLMRLARKSSKPILTFKANIGRLGKRIAASHTASLSSDDHVVQAAFDQAGVLRIHDSTSLGNSLKILELPPMRGRNLAIISRSGGHAVIAADACELAGFNLAQLPEAFLDEIESHFRASVIRLTNPLDLGDLFDLDVYAQIVERTLQLKDVDGVVFLHTSISEAEHQASRELVERIVGMVERYDKPVAYYVSADSHEVNYLKHHYNFPIFTQIVETIRALEISHRQCCQFSKPIAQVEVPAFDVKKTEVEALISQARAEGRDLLLSGAMRALRGYGIPTIRSKLAADVEQARAAAEEIGYPVAIKVISEAISHKSDVGGVQLNLRNGRALAAAFEDMMAGIQRAYPGVPVDGVLVQPMVTSGRELIIGGRQDPQFGPVVLLGMGGVFVEILNRVSVRVTPITRAGAMEMVQELPGSQILTGARGAPPSDIDSVADALLRLSQLLWDFPEIQEVDVNPLMVFHGQEGCRALDARVILSPNGLQDSHSPS
jgi:acyl-CoA synthetase (NDP forming)